MPLERDAYALSRQANFNQVKQRARGSGILFALILHRRTNETNEHKREHAPLYRIKSKKLKFASALADQLQLSNRF